MDSSRLRKACRRVDYENSSISYSHSIWEARRPCLWTLSATNLWTPKSLWSLLIEDYHDSVLNALDERVGIIHVGRPASSRNPWYFVKLRHILRRLKPDILHTHGEHIIEMIPFRSVPAVTTIHDTRVRYQAPFASIGTFLPFPRQSGTMCRPLSRFRHRSFMTASIFPGSAKGEFGSRPFRVVQISRLVHQKKGQDIMLRALSHVNEKWAKGRVPSTSSARANRVSSLKTSPMSWA